MTDINDKIFRHTLIERFLDCDTTVAEERELAQFYAKCRKNGRVPEGEDDICELVTATVPAVTAAGNRAEAHETAGKRHAPRLTHWQWAAAACIVTAIAAGTAVWTAAYDKESTVPAANLAMKETDGNDGHKTAPKEEMPENRDIAFDDNACRHDDVFKDYSARRPKKASRHAAAKAAATNDGAPTAVDMNNVYDMAVAAFQDADGITLERKGDAVLLTAADDDGTCRRYVVGEVGDGQITLHDF